MNTSHIIDRGEGPAIIMVHGWGQTMKSFAPLVDTLATGFRVITFDLPGYGKAKGETGPYRFDRYCNAIANIVVKKNLTDFHLLGWSMGGTIAAKYLLEKAGPPPTSLILMSASPRFVAPGKGLGIGQSLTAVKKMIRMMKQDPVFGLRSFISMFFASGEAIPPESNSAITKLLAPPETFPPKDEALIATLEELASTDLTKMAAGLIAPPVMLLYGALDRVTPRGGQLLWDTIFSRVIHYPLDGVGHAPHLTRLDEVTKAVTRFVHGAE